jgi:TonB family protein
MNVSTLTAGTAQAPASAAARAAGTASDTISLWDVFTLVIWPSCLLVGVTGIFWRYTGPQLAVPEPALIQAQTLHVELSNDPLPSVEEPPPPPVIPTAQPPPVPERPVIPSTPPLVAVAEPHPAVAFPLPVKGPVQIVPVEEAIPVRVAPTNVPPPPPAAVQPQPLVYGVGEGRQPAPEYPAAALRAGQEGTVGVRFSVGPNGRVLSAEVITGSPWSLLNSAALRVIRERWRFRAGPTRLYDVSIRFELTQ